MQALASDLLLTKGMTQLHTPIHHTAEEQVKIIAIFLHAIHLPKEMILLQRSWLKVHLLHIRRVDTKHTEARIYVHAFGFLLDLLACPADALLTDLADGGVARLTCLTILRRLLGQLHADVLALTAIFSIQLHHGVCRSG